jgi:16S rRNA (guanine966-N2)-methyltransferase
VLDLFAGSGAMGIEALSRGAATALFVEREPAAVQALRKNLETLQLTGRATVVARNVRRALPLLRQEAPFNLVLLDPPYGDREVTESLLLELEPAERLTPEGVLVLEAAAGADPPSLQGLEEPLTRRWGHTAVHLYRRHQPRTAHE